MRKGYALTVANPRLHRRRGSPIQSFADRSLKNAFGTVRDREGAVEREDTEGEVARRRVSHPSRPVDFQYEAFSMPYVLPGHPLFLQLRGDSDFGRRCRSAQNIQHTTRYTELAADRFKDFWRDWGWSRIKAVAG